MLSVPEERPCRSQHKVMKKPSELSGDQLSQREPRTSVGATGCSAAQGADSPSVTCKETRIRPAPGRVLQSFWGKQLSAQRCISDRTAGTGAFSVTLLESSLKTGSCKGRGTHEKGPRGVGGCCQLAWSRGSPRHTSGKAGHLSGWDSKAALWGHAREDRRGPVPGGRCSGCVRSEGSVQASAETGLEASLGWQEGSRRATATLGRELGRVGAREWVGQTPWGRGEDGEVSPGTATCVHASQQMNWGSFWRGCASYLRHVVQKTVPRTGKGGLIKRQSETITWRKKEHVRSGWTLAAPTTTRDLAVDTQAPGRRWVTEGAFARRQSGHREAGAPATCGRTRRREAPPLLRGGCGRAGCADLKDAVFSGPARGCLSQGGVWNHGQRVGGTVPTLF
ncbi:uncharacterized protein LOC115945086 [Leptonychotes weddellii]|uniref:Uncharacterized protein LOC115945086 n=1 Tax=Leptonychotes weddellii TaxID=9713 RepID=A0A7F8RXQ5_LEPWE|nr:uncharacterized protein LOC115945086 [Leptonychotes weddellii]XP_030897940.1 uncharacterized protein LOC115945086 [Leptonychotes weddellii]XP_030897941.1 uncharacterized protein LOC115945086 [Leptonychotes weddellii]